MELVAVCVGVRVCTLLPEGQLGALGLNGNFGGVGGFIHNLCSLC